MRKVVLIFGLLSGTLISGFMAVALVIWETTRHFYDNALVGYASMVIALSMVFFGIKSYRDNYQSGTIKFWKGVQVGALITLVASLMYAVTWETYTHVRPASFAEFVDKCFDSPVNKMKERGASSAEIEQTVKRIDTMKRMYQNPVIRFGMTLMEILPVGIIITLISAAVLRKRELLPAGHIKLDVPTN